jgi:hypothetical protein
MTTFFGHTLKLAFMAGLSLFFCGNSARAADCDRACMKDMITRYLNAMVAHDPSKLPLAPNVRFT